MTQSKSINPEMRKKKLSSDPVFIFSGYQSEAKLLTILIKALDKNIPHPDIARNTPIITPRRFFEDWE